MKEQFPSFIGGKKEEMPVTYHLSRHGDLYTHDEYLALRESAKMQQAWGGLKRRMHYEVRILPKDEASYRRLWEQTQEIQAELRSLLTKIEASKRRNAKVVPIPAGELLLAQKKPGNGDVALLEEEKGLRAKLERVAAARKRLEK